MPPRAPSRSSSAPAARSPPADAVPDSFPAGRAGSAPPRPPTASAAGAAAARNDPEAPSLHATTLDPAAPPAMRSRRRNTEADCRPLQRHPTLDREHQLAPTSQSELRVSVPVHHGPPFIAACLGGRAQPQRRAGCISQPFTTCVGGSSRRDRPRTRPTCSRSRRRGAPRVPLGIVERTDDRLALGDREREPLHHSPVGVLEPGTRGVVRRPAGRARVRRETVVTAATSQIPV